MAGFFDRAQATAARMTAKFGEAATIRRPTAGSGSSRNPGVGTPTELPCHLAFDDYSASERDGTRIQQNDKRVLVTMDDASVSLTTADQIVIAGQVHAIVTLQRYGRTGEIVMWTVQARR